MFHIRQMRPLPTSLRQTGTAGRLLLLLKQLMSRLHSASLHSTRNLTAEPSMHIYEHCVPTHVSIRVVRAVVRTCIACQAGLP